MNKYEAPTIAKIGRARELILGVKPDFNLIDSETQPNKAERVADIDETDE